MPSLDFLKSQSLDFVKEETGYLMKGEGQDEYIFEGIASSYGNVDCYGDIFDQDSLKGNYNKTVTILSDHDWRVGSIIGKGVLSGDKDKVLIKGNFTKGIEKADNIVKLKNDEVPLKLSIGGRIKKWEIKRNGDDYVRIIKEAEIVEVSVVFRGANPQAQITKSAYQDLDLQKLDNIIDKLIKIYGGN